MGKMKASSEGADMGESLRSRSTKNTYSEALTAEERTLLEDMRELLVDAEVMEEFEATAWLRVDLEMWNQVKGKL
jgi:hypothetical protein